MRTSWPLFLASVLSLLLGLLDAQSSGCYNVQYATSYDELKDETLFSYTLSSTGEDDCPSLSQLSLDTSCPGPCYPPSSDWVWEDPLPDDLSSQTFTIRVPGNNAPVCTGQWNVVTEAGVYSGLTCVPDCRDVPTDPQATCPIQFSVEELTLTPGQSVDIQVILGGDPEGDVTVILESNCAFLSECTLDFNSGNFAVPQTVTVTAGDFNLATVCYITAVTEGAVCAGDQVEINQPQEPNGPGGMIYGDPHVVTFSNTRYQIPDVGVYTLVQASNGQFIAQVRTDNCQRKGHCTFQLAIQKGTFLATLTMDFAGNLVQVDTGNAPENGVTLETRPDGSYWFYLTTGIRIAARAAYTPSTLQYSMMVVVTVGASSRGEVAGLLGDAESPKNGDLLLPDGTIALFANLQDFIDAWEITQASLDLFQSYPTPIAIPVVTGFTPFDPNSIDFNCAPA